MIEDNLISDNQLFIALTETWLRDHLDAELYIPNYQIFRADRVRKVSKHGRDSGGVAIYLHSQIANSFEVMLSHSNGVIEVLALYSAKENLVIAVVYRQPDDKTHGHPSGLPEFSHLIDELTRKIQSLDVFPDIILGGDFNIPHVSWPDGNPLSECNKNHKDLLSKLQDICNILMLNQHVTHPTHKDGNILDLVFTNNDRLVHSVEIIPTLRSNSHHSIVRCSTLFKSKLNNCTPQYPTQPKISKFDSLNFYSDEIDWESINKDLSTIDWSAELNQESVDEMLHKFYEICLGVCATKVPSKTKNKNSKKPFIQRKRINLNRRRRRINKLLLKVTSPSRTMKLKQELIDIEIKLQELYRNIHDFQEQKAVAAIKKNPKYFYNYAKKFTKIKSKVGPLIADGKTISDPACMANTLLKQYNSVFSIPRGESSSKNSTPDEDIGTNIADIAFDEEDFITAINELSENAASGPDGLPAIFLKQCKETVSKPLTIFWKKSIATGVIPDILKWGIVIPVHKGGSYGNPSNYRPIALTSQIIKLFEKILRSHLVQYLEQNNLLNAGQHGFRGGRSCLTQLIDHYDYVLSQVELGKNVDVIYLDFAKAFDKVDFSIVLNKMKLLGIKGSVYNWIQCFLRHRTHSVLVDGCLSQKAPVLSGVPQGSVLGPLIFLILIGDIDKDVKTSRVSSFADDTRVAKGVQDVKDVSFLQGDINSINSWADDNNMTFNDSKFELLRYGKDDILKSCTHLFDGNGKIIQEKLSVRDLGVIMSNNLQFQDHINNVLLKGRNMCSWVLRTFRNRTSLCMLTLWKSLVLPKIEYCSQLWCPYKKGNLQDLESLQWTFIRKVDVCRGLNYWQALHKLRLYSIERRFERYRIIHVWKILEGLVPNFSEHPITTTFNKRTGRKCCIECVKSSALGTLRTASLPVHGARLFNSLPKHTRSLSSCSLEVFKSSLDKFLSSLPDEPLIPGYTQFRRAESNSILNMVRVDGRRQRLQAGHLDV